MICAIFSISFSRAKKITEFWYALEIECYTKEIISDSRSIRLEDVGQYEYLDLDIKTKISQRYSRSTVFGASLTILHMSAFTNRKFSSSEDRNLLSLE